MAEAAILKRLDKVRDFNVNTCAASRHVHMIVEQMLDCKSPLARAIEGADFEAGHIGKSIAVVLEGLWEARQFMKWQELPPENGMLANGRWVPDPEKLLASSAAKESE